VSPSALGTAPEPQQQHPSALSLLVYSLRVDTLDFL